MQAYKHINYFPLYCWFVGKTKPMLAYSLKSVCVENGNILPI